MEEGGDLSLAEAHLTEAYAMRPHDKAIQHSFAVLSRRQAVATNDILLRQRLRERARGFLNGHIGVDVENAHAFLTLAQLTFDELREILTELKSAEANQLTERRIVELARDFERYVQDGLQRFPLNEHLLAIESEYRQLAHEYVQAETALRKAFNANPRQDWVAIRLARTLDAAGKSHEAKEILIKSLQENPASKRIHYELAMLYMKGGGDSTFVVDHLRRSFTVGDQNYEAQFWYARGLFLAGKTDEAKETFRSLRDVSMPVKLRNLVRGTVTDSEGRGRVYLGEVASIEDAYMFVRCADLRKMYSFIELGLTMRSGRTFREGGG